MNFNEFWDNYQMWSSQTQINEGNRDIALRAWHEGKKCGQSEAWQRLRPYVSHHALSCNINNQQVWDDAIGAEYDLSADGANDPSELYAIEQAQYEATARRIKCSCGFEAIVGETIGRAELPPVWIVPASFLLHL